MTQTLEGTKNSFYLYWIARCQQNTNKTVTKRANRISAIQHLDRIETIRKLFPADLYWSIALSV